MDYEGPEKKLELTCKDSIDFLSYPDSYWHELLQECGAQVLNLINGSMVKAFLISESSLFVWKNRVLMITCGQTQLIKSAQMLIHDVGQESIQSLYFARKNEHYPDQQKTFAREDFKTLRQELGAGQGYRFGHRDLHHAYIFEYVASGAQLISEHIAEVLIYRLSDHMTNMFLSSTTKQRQDLQASIENLFLGFEFDHHWFEPCGYSANAFKNNLYATVHVTPEKDQSYISFETNNLDRLQLQKWLMSVQELFGAQAMDVIYYDNTQKTPLDLTPLSGFWTHTKTYQELQGGAGLTHLYWCRAQENWLTPVSL